MDPRAELIHEIARREYIRGKVLRTLRSECEMLVDGILALRRGKTHVMFDHAERVLYSLQQTIKYLEKEGEDGERSTSREAESDSGIGERDKV